MKPLCLLFIPLLHHTHTPTSDDAAAGASGDNSGGLNGLGLNVGRHLGSSSGRNGNSMMAMHMHSMCVSGDDIAAAEAARRRCAIIRRLWGSGVV